MIHIEARNDVPVSLLTDSLDAPILHVCIQQLDRRTPRVLFEDVDHLAENLKRRASHVLTTLCEDFRCADIKLEG